jgi:DNA polymerase III subunit alpha
VAQRFKRTFGDNYFLEVQMFPELESVRTINQAWERLGRELGIQLVATGDCHYTQPDEGEMQQILHSVGRHKSMEQLAQDWGYDVPLAPPLTDMVALERLMGTGLSLKAARQAMKNTQLIANSCDADIPQMDPIRFPLPKGFKSTREVWRKWLEDGWYFRNMPAKKGMRDAQGRSPKQRLKYEMDIIESKNFVDYFLVVSDIVKFSKDSNIPVGPARGSAAASLVCYLLRITEVNPMEFPNMMFERFIDYERQDLPDIDLDFDDEERYRVFEYASQRYGRDKVGKIGTFQYYKSKNSLDDIAHVFHVPKYQVEKVNELLLERSSGDLRASATIEDTVAQFEDAKAVFDEYPDLWKATELEGNVKTMSTHAAGLVVATRPITDVCAVYTSTDPKGNIRMDDFGNPRQIVSFDKYDAEEHNLLKVDILGLANMGMIRIMCELTGMTLQEVYDLPRDDEETIKGFQENDCIGIFQFDGWAMRSVNGSLKPENFDEIAAVNALARPGPLHSNASVEYVEVKRGQAEPTITHPLLDPIVAPTRGQIIYQEQILRIMREIGDFEWSHVSYIRKIISRKIGEQEFNRQKATFAKGARKKGMDEETINQIWGACITAGGYAFNVPHCVSYGLLGYWTMWFKRHHPQAFFTAALRKLKAKRRTVLRDAEEHLIQILPPNLAESGVGWHPHGEQAVIAGFSQIPKVGEKTATAIIDERNKKPFSDWGDLLRVKGIGKKSIEGIVAFCESEDPFEIHTLSRRIEKVKREIRTGSLKGLPYPTHSTSDIPMDRGADIEVVWLGTVHSRNLRDLFEVNYGKTGEQLDIETVKRPDLPEWVIMYGEDDTDQMSITVDRFRYPRFKERVWGIELDYDLVLVRGIKRGYQARRHLYVWDMWVIDPEDNE